MPTIPTIQPFVPSIQQPFGVRADTSMVNPLAQAGERVGAAVAGIGDQLNDFEQRKQEAVNWATELKIQNEQQARTAAFQESLKDPNNPQNLVDPKDPDAGYMARMGDMHGDYDEWLGKQNLPPIVAPHAAATSAAWKQQNSTALNNQLVQLDVSKAMGDFQTSYSMSLKSQDVESALAKTDKAESLRLISPEQAAQMRVQAPKTADHYAASDYIVQHPTLAPDAILDKSNWPHLDPDARQTLLSEANRQAAASRVRTAEDFGSRLAAGEEIPQQEVKQAVMDKQITPAQAKSITGPPAKTLDRSAYADVKNRIAAIDPADPKMNEKMADITGDIIENRGLDKVSAELRDDLHRRADAKDIRNSPPANEGNKLIDEKYTAMTKGHEEWTQPTDAEKEAGATAHWRTVVPPGALDSAQEERARVQTLFNNYLETHPNPKPDEVQSFIHSAFVPQARVASFSSAPTTMPAATATGKNGEKYILKDGKWQTQ